MAIRSKKTFFPEAQGLLTVDPGDHTGHAFWDGSLLPLVDAFHVNRKIVEQEQQLTFMWSKFEILLETYKPRYVIIEGVEYWEGSLISRTSAHRQDLVKLSYLAGGYGLCCARKGIAWQFLPAPRWKGQMNKEATALRVRRATGQEYVGSHRTDAVGIGLAFMRIL